MLSVLEKIQQAVQDQVGCYVSLIFKILNTILSLTMTNYFFLYSVKTVSPINSLIWTNCGLMNAIPEHVGVKVNIFHQNRKILPVSVPFFIFFFLLK